MSLWNQFNFLKDTSQHGPSKVIDPGEFWWKNQGKSKTAIGRGAAVYLAKGSSALLGDEIANGGEGKIFRLQGSKNTLIKIYKASIRRHPGRSKEMEERIGAMTEISALMKHKRFAWPRNQLYDQNGGFIGFGMRALAGRSLHHLGTLQQLEENHPDWNRLHLARIAWNIAKGLHFLHQHNVLIGDLNPGNIHYSEDCRVHFLDCDSYQVSVGNRYFPCPGLVDLYTSPEILRDARLAGRRKPESEYFVYAILVFQLLMFGLHPFSRREQMDPVKAMRDQESPWIRDNLTGTPMGAWNGYWYSLPDSIKQQFRKAFQQPHQPRSRPDLPSWMGVLEECVKAMAKTPRLARIPRFKN